MYTERPFVFRITFYFQGSSVIFLSADVFTYHMENPAQDREYTINCKRKVVQFVYRWVVTIRHPVFDDVISMSFLEVIATGNIHVD